MNRIVMPLFLLYLALSSTVWGASPWSSTDTLCQGIVVEKWELGKWQVDGDICYNESYSRLRVLLEYPVELRGRVVTIYYNKWAVPKQFIPRRKGVRCGFTVASGVAGMESILWPMLHQFWIGSLPTAPRALPEGTAGDSL